MATDGIGPGLALRGARLKERTGDGTLLAASWLPEADGTGLCSSDMSAAVKKDDSNSESPVTGDGVEGSEGIGEGIGIRGGEGTGEGTRSGFR